MIARTTVCGCGVAPDVNTFPLARNGTNTVEVRSTIPVVFETIQADAVDSKALLISSVLPCLNLPLEGLLVRGTSTTLIPEHGKLNRYCSPLLFPPTCLSTSFLFAKCLRNSTVFSR